MFYGKNAAMPISWFLTMVASAFSDNAVDAPADGNDRNELTIAVGDTGPGIPDSLRSRIFDPFVQHDDLTAPHGTGLGLAIARRLTERMGGSLVLESSSEYGSCFTLRLGRLRIAPDQQSLPSGNS